VSVLTADKVRLLAHQSLWKNFTIEIDAYTPQNRFGSAKTFIIRRFLNSTKQNIAKKEPKITQLSVLSDHWI
jgi:hypothetical protein